MAESTFQVDPDNSGGTDYISLNAYESTEQANLTTASDNHVVTHLSSSGTADTTGVTFDGWVMDYDAGETVVINGETSVTGWDTSISRLEVTDAIAFYNQEDAVIVNNMQIGVVRSTTGTTTVVAIDSTGNSDTDGGTTLDGCRIRTSGSANDGYIILHAAGFNTPFLLVQNCLIYGAASTATSTIRINYTSLTATFYNNTILGACGRGLWNQNGTVKAVNNIVNDHSSTDFDGTFTSSNYNASEDTTSPGANSVDSFSGTFTNKTNFDLSLDAANDTAVDDEGIGPSSDANVPTADFAGNTRSGTTCSIGALELTASITSALTGTATASITESDIVTGGKTVILTLTGDTWAAAGTGPIGSTADTQALIDGMDSAQVEATGWNAEVRDKEVTTAVVRTSNTVATITLTAAAAYDITAQETITVTIPAATLVTSAIDVVASPTFTIDAVGGGTILPMRRRLMMRNSA